MNIIAGKASWFITTLILSELLFITILRWSKNKVLMLALTSILGLAVALILSKTTIHNPWCFQQSLAVFCLLFLGFVFHQYEQYFRHLNWTYVLLSTAVLIVILKVIVEKENIVLNIYPLEISNLTFYFMDTIVGISLIIAISKLIAKNKLLEYTGKLSIIIYFLNGGVSVITSRIMNQVGFSYDEQYFRVIILFFINYLIVLFVSHMIYQYLPFMIGRNEQTAK
jgi:fucose 4-O-acetylase-like acetyltransferase